MKEMGVTALIGIAALSLLFLYHSDKDNAALNERIKQLEIQNQASELVIKGMLMNR